MKDMLQIQTRWFLVNYKIFLFFVIGLLLSACSNNTESINGIWSIEMVSYGDVEHGSYYGRLIQFNPNGECILPKRSMDEVVNICKWSVEIKDGKIGWLLVSSTDSIFNGRYSVTNRQYFDPKDENKLILSGVDLVNDNVTIRLNGRLSGYW